MKSAFDKIKAGLDDAMAFVESDDSDWIDLSSIGGPEVQAHRSRPGLRRWRRWGDQEWEAGAPPER